MASSLGRPHLQPSRQMNTALSLDGSTSPSPNIATCTRTTCVFQTLLRPPKLQLYLVFIIHREPLAKLIERLPLLPCHLAP